MKKIFTLFGAIALTCSVYGQGLISINSTLVFTTNSVGYGGSSGNMANVLNDYYFTILVNTTYPGLGTPTISSISSLTASSWLQTGVLGTNATGIPRAGNISGILANPGATANNWASGTTDYFVVVGWSASLGNNWLTVSNEIANTSWNTLTGSFGWSTVGNGTSTSSPSPGFSVFGSSLPGQVSSPFTLFNVQSFAATPEPSTMALAALGGASLLLFRRRKL